MGYFDEFTPQSYTTGVEDVEAEFYKSTQPAALVEKDNAIPFYVRATAGVAQTGSVVLELNGVELLDIPVTGAGAVDVIVEGMIWRTGDTQARVEAQATDDTGAVTRFAVADLFGLAWNRAQILRVVGLSTVANGLTLVKFALKR